MSVVFHPQWISSCCFQALEGVSSAQDENISMEHQFKLKESKKKKEVSFFRRKSKWNVLIFSVLFAFLQMKINLLVKKEFLTVWNLLYSNKILSAEYFWLAYSKSQNLRLRRWKCRPVLQNSNPRMILSFSHSQNKMACNKESICSEIA